MVTALIVFAVMRLTGVDISGLLGGGGTSSASSSSSSSEPYQGTPEEEELYDFVEFALGDMQTTFGAMFEKQGKRYENAKLVVFTKAVDSGCGRASSSIGPFYCPADKHAYIDLSFYQDLRKRFGAPGDFAQAYVLAHEVGHHLQNLFGVGGSRDNAHSVRVELQADCYAGIWAKAAQGKKLLEIGDLEEALTAAAAIGDDRLQQQAGVEVKPESFTHGSSQQRVAWFRRGFDAGTFQACDTFSGEP